MIFCDRVLFSPSVYLRTVQFAPRGFYFTNLQFDACVRKRGFIRIVGDEDNGFARKTRKQICDDLQQHFGAKAAFLQQLAQQLLVRKN